MKTMFCFTRGIFYLLNVGTVLMSVACSGGSASQSSLQDSAAKVVTECSFSYLSEDSVNMLYLAEAIQCIVDGDASGFASHCSYPLSRPNPLCAIQDSAAMVQYFDILFDDSIRNVLKTKTGISHWSSMGPGYMFDHGMIWDICHIGKIYSINYSSPQERRLVRDVIDRDISCLDPSLRGNWRCYQCFQAPNGYVFRIDAPLKEDEMWSRGDIYRLTVFRDKRSISGKPLYVMFGEREPMGGYGNEEFCFSDKSGNKAVYENNVVGGDNMEPHTITLEGSMNYSSSMLKFSHWDEIGK